MGWKFNPFTGALDQTGSGGGGSSYIDGEVATYNDLPLDGTAALNSAWLVRTASGVWPVSRKQAGIYIRTATAGSSRDADYTYAGTMPDVFSDAVLTIYDEASTTRTGQFNLGSVTAGQNRVLTWPDGNGTIARTEDFAAPPAIGSTTRNTGAFTTLSANNGTVTTSTPALTVTQTLNGANTNVVFSLAEFTFTNTTSSVNSTYINCVTGGISHFSVRRSGLVQGTEFLSSNGFRANGNGNSGGQVFLTSNGSYCFVDSTTSTFGTADLFLRRDAAGILAQHNLANPQTFRIYNTTDAGLTNYERGFMRWSSNVLQIGTEKAGTGSARNVELQRDGTTVATLGGSGEFRLTSTGQLAFASRGAILMSADGVMWLSNNAGTDFGRLAFGGTTSSFPALKRSSTTLQVRLADDSAYSVLDAQLRAQGTAPASSGATGTAGDIRYDADYIYVCTAANTWKRAAIATW